MRPTPRSAFCDECWPFHNVEVTRLTKELESTRRHVKRLNNMHNVEIADHRIVKSRLDALDEAQTETLFALAEAIGGAAYNPKDPTSVAKYVRILAEERDDAEKRYNLVIHLITMLGEQ